ncbi:hypothetical protein RLO149_c029510 [Roseobacter litoralis Och 149]|uniref:Uncharacterized protein n=1 Tax=Roseobacter litoralis (strain ATCC 49566 / DSM 6996 / JCM 21268 / NBRC 15278 / OCh 149) TaxID=391595 RepID=F7ZH65_ROSLO|nr:hypothetical protein RLO149_c029510 [Roseobacter litoralis Och 149]
MRDDVARGRFTHEGGGQSLQVHHPLLAYCAFIQGLIKGILRRDAIPRAPAIRTACDSVLITCVWPSRVMRGAGNCDVMAVRARTGVLMVLSFFFANDFQRLF